MSWRQIISGAKTEFPDPMVTVSASGLLFNSVAVQEIGTSYERVCLFTDVEKKYRLGFCFFKANLPGSFSFKKASNGHCRRISLARFLKQNGILEKARKCNKKHFPLREIKEEIPDFEGSQLFCIEIQ